MEEITPWIQRQGRFVCLECGHENDCTSVRLNLFEPYFCANCGTCHDEKGLWERRRVERRAEEENDGRQD